MVAGKVEEPDVALSQAVLLIKGAKRPIKCFICLGNMFLTLRERIISYVIPASVGRHVLEKHVGELKDGLVLIEGFVIPGKRLRSLRYFIQRGFAGLFHRLHRGWCRSQSNRPIV